MAINNTWHAMFNVHSGPATDMDKLVPKYIPVWTYIDPASVPTGLDTYMTREYNRDAQGYYTGYCFASMMDNQSNCHNDCPFPLFWGITRGLCYGVSHP
jgi:hypothetical protein